MSYTYIYINMYITYTPLYIYICIYIYMSHCIPWICIYIYIHIIYKHICTHATECTYIYIYCIFLCTYIYIYDIIYQGMWTYDDIVAAVLQIGWFVSHLPSARCFSLAQVVLYPKLWLWLKSNTLDSLLSYAPCIKKTPDAISTRRLLQGEKRNGSTVFLGSVFLRGYQQVDLFDVAFILTNTSVYIYSSNVYIYIYLFIYISYQRKFRNLNQKNGRFGLQVVALVDNRLFSIYDGVAVRKKSCHEAMTRIWKQNPTWKWH